MKNFLVLQTDFGQVDGAVSAMIGVSLNEDPSLIVHHLTHEITPYNIFEASYRLLQTVPFWPVGTVFVSVVDPGVGTKRKSIVAKLSSGHYIVTPDNGTLTHLAQTYEILEAKEIAESRHRRKNSEKSYTFHGRDVYALTGAKLASGHISFEEVGPQLDVSKLELLVLVPVIVNENKIIGTIDILDVRFGSLWTSVLQEQFNQLQIQVGEMVWVKIYNSHQLVYHNSIKVGHSFADVAVGSPVVYINSLYRVGVAINQGSFAKAYSIGTGHQWQIHFERVH